MKNAILNLHKGFYTLREHGATIHITVDYENKQYQISFEKNTSSEVLKQLKKYAEDFAQRMIESKHGRNFFEVEHAHKLHLI